MASLPTWLRRTRPQAAPEPARAEAATPQPASRPAAEVVGFTALFGAVPTAPPRQMLPLFDTPVLAPAVAFVPASPAVAVPAAEPPAEPADGAATAEVLAAWAMEESAFWRLNPVSRSVAEQQWRTINDTVSSVFVYRFVANTVELAGKPETLEIRESEQGRADCYLLFFRSLADRLPADYEATIAVGLADKLPSSFGLPIFCFQRHRAEKSLLLPDIDLLQSDFLRDPGFADTLGYAEKMDIAVFVGSTTGGMIDAAVARDCAIPRLRAARFFVGNERVQFVLPQITQTLDGEARAILEGMPFCTPGRIGWQQQFQDRFVISMDGNGATCSRVAIALRSNSVLLKYHSDDILFYFRGLQPWLHFVPVMWDEDVEKIMDVAQREPGTFETVARRGREFAETYLTREAATAYTTGLLLRYRDCFVDETSPSGTVPAQADGSRKGFLLAHLQQRGDTVAGADGWVGEVSSNLLVEGFSLSFANLGMNRRVAYRALQADGTLGEAQPGGQYCGTRSQNMPIYGFVLDVVEEADLVPPITYDGVFQDGSRRGPLKPGAVCRAPTLQPLMAMRVTVGEEPG